MRRLPGLLLLAGLSSLLCARVVAHVRLIHPTSGAALRWSAPGNVGVVIGSDASDDITDGSHTTALRLAIAEWNAAAGTTATLMEDASAASRARTDYAASDVHLILFDESNASGFFHGGSSTVALTPVWFYANGLIHDADVLFNGGGFAFTTSGAPGAFDVQDIAAHELGHLLGLDHSGASGATLFPFVDQGLVLQRSLSEDERAGLRAAYPAGSSGTITGTVERFEDGRPVAGAYVVARDDGGRTRASILADVNGAFALRGLVPDTYSVYARPLDWTVDESNLGPWWSGKTDTDFAPALYPGTAAITAANTVALGVLRVPADAALALGTPFDTLPVRAVAGESRTVVLHGSGLVPGATLAASDPDLVLGVPLFQGAQVSFQLTVPSDEERGHVDLAVTNAAGELSILPAALEITPPAPTVGAVVPGVGSVAGGDALALAGTGFAAGARVVIGDRIYTDGIDATVVDEGTLVLTTAAMLPGLHDVVVIDPSGVEGRAPDAFRALSAPDVGTALPGAGNAAGGTTVVLAGAGFEEGMRVRIDGVEQGPVTVVSATRASFTTLGGGPGGPYVLAAENPDGASATWSFSYVDQPDPALAGVAPTQGTTGGGTVLTLSGSGFTPAMQVAFLVDPATSLVPAASVTFVDASTLSVVTPPHAAGAVALLVAEPNGCGVFTADAFSFTVAPRGGGGCSTVPYEGMPFEGTPVEGLRERLAGAGWILLVLGWAFARSRSARRVAACA